MSNRVGRQHQEELTKFLKFFRSRLRTHLENIEADFEDTHSDRLSADDVYSQKDIKEVLTSLSSAIKANVRSELQDTINMMALILRQIFAEAESNDLTLELDIGSVEDRELLARVERLSVSEWVEEENGSSRHSALKKTDTQKEAEHEKETKKLKKQLGDANETIQELEKELKEATQHVAQTPQFQSMKKMVAQKNEQLQRLRDRLQRYEPFEGEIEDE